MTTATVTTEERKIELFGWMISQRVFDQMNKTWPVRQACYSDSYYRGVLISHLDQIHKDLGEEMKRA